MMTNTRFVGLLFTLLLSLVHAGTTPEGLKWLEAKKAEKGVVETPSGLRKSQCEGNDQAYRRLLHMTP